MGAPQEELSPRSAMLTNPSFLPVGKQQSKTTKESGFYKGADELELEQNDIQRTTTSDVKAIKPEDNPFAELEEKRR